MLWFAVLLYQTVIFKMAIMATNFNDSLRNRTAVNNFIHICTRRLLKVFGIWTTVKKFSMYKFMIFIIITCLYCPTAGQIPPFPPSTFSGLWQFWTSLMRRSPARLAISFWACRVVLSLHLQGNVRIRIKFRNAR